jgi:Nucleotidyl transferase AbiEii toxin, Type IV TA system
MVTPRQYATAGALRTALETRLLERSRRDAVDLHRLRRQVAFARLLARMFDANLPRRDGWVLKGGYALEMRFHRARATKDLDLTVRVTSIGQPPPDDLTAALRERLQLAASVELADFFVFNVGEASLELNQAPEGGSRFPVDARLDGRSFVKFHVDLGVGDEVIEPVDRIVGDDWLAFARHSDHRRADALGRTAKLHAYTLPPDGATNSRVKDLVDLVLLIELQAMSPTRIHVAVATTFARRGTHAVPTDLPPPPSAWEKPFTALAAECGTVHTLTSAYENVAAYWRSLTERSEAR